MNRVYPDDINEADNIARLLSWYVNAETLIFENLDDDTAAALHQICEDIALDGSPPTNRFWLTWRKAAMGVGLDTDTGFTVFVLLGTLSVADYNTHHPSPPRSLQPSIPRPQRRRARGWPYRGRTRPPPHFSPVEGVDTPWMRIDRLDLVLRKGEGEVVRDEVAETFLKLEAAMAAHKAALTKAASESK